jgi:hypothetical protein
VCSESTRQYHSGGHDWQHILNVKMCSLSLDISTQYPGRLVQATVRVTRQLFGVAKSYTYFVVAQPSYLKLQSEMEREDDICQGEHWDEQATFRKLMKLLAPTTFHGPRLKGTAAPLLRGRRRRKARNRINEFAVSVTRPAVVMKSRVRHSDLKTSRTP